MFECFCSVAARLNAAICSTPARVTFNMHSDEDYSDDSDDSDEDVIRAIDEEYKVIDVRNGEECVICFEKVKEPKAFYTCGHVCVCRLCALQRAALGDYTCAMCGAPLANYL